MNTYQNNDGFLITANEEVEFSEDSMWINNPKAKNFVNIDKKKGTFTIIPTLENLDKKLMLYVFSVLHENCLLMKTYSENLIIELPKYIQNLLKSVFNIDFTFRFYNRLFHVTMQDDATLHIVCTEDEKLPEESKYLIEKFNKDYPNEIDIYDLGKITHNKNFYNWNFASNYSYPGREKDLYFESDFWDD